jgi:hypothetical protein
MKNKLVAKDPSAGYNKQILALQKDLDAATLKLMEYSEYNDVIDKARKKKEKRNKKKK